MAFMVRIREGNILIDKSRIISNYIELAVLTGMLINSFNL